MTHLVKIGNSQGIRIPKPIIEQAGLEGQELQLLLVEEGLLLTPTKKPREGWEIAFKEMNENGDDILLIDDIFKDENLVEWS